MTAVSASGSTDLLLRWRRWSICCLERLPVPYSAVVVGVTLWMALEQILEWAVSDPGIRYPPGQALRQGAVIVGIAVYILLHLRFLKRETVRGLGVLRPAVQVSDQEYDDDARRMLRADWRAELLLFFVALLVVLGLFVGLRGDLMNLPSGLPASLPLAVFMAATYILLGWLLLTLVYTSIRYARALGALANRPLVINVFDPGNLLAFGRLSLIQSLSAVGLLLIPLVLLGPPRRAGFLVVFVAIISLLALFVPIWGVHRQIIAGRHHVLGEIHAELMKAQEDLLSGEVSDPQKLGALSGRTAALGNLRKMIQESSSWPFRSEGAVFRASLVVASPLIYFILNQLIQFYVLRQLVR